MVQKVIPFLLFVLPFNGCMQNDPFLQCTDCSQLKGLSLRKKQGRIYSFSLIYPVGTGHGDSFEPHFSLEMDLEICERVINVSDLDGHSYQIWNFDNQSKSQSIFTYNNHQLTSSVDTTFIGSSGEEIFACRLGNLWLKPYDNPMGSDLVMFISRSGVHGMYISRSGKENFDVDYREYVFYPIGSLFYLQNDREVKIIGQMK